MQLTMMPPSLLAIGCCIVLAYAQPAAPVAAAAPAAPAAPAGKLGEVIIGDVRVQCLSATLVRLEPRGPAGFEDRNTFMVTSREFPGLPVTVKKQADGSVIRTASYSVLLREKKLPNGHLNFVIFGPAGAPIYDAGKDTNDAPDKLMWPSPLSASAYALVDHPRFYVPPWATTPPPAGKGGGPNNGYDFGNDVYGDTYVFLLGNGLDGWKASRGDFLKLCGQVPLLPDHSFGLWFTWWHQYKEAEAKADIAHWEASDLPIDIWGLDVGWRVYKPEFMEHTYDHPSPGFDMDEFLGFLKSQGLHTFFNDHPFPKGEQTSPEEVDFRWTSLTQWMGRGVGGWWVDRNWMYTIPPPQTQSHEKTSSWEGLSNVAWMSHVYYSIVQHYRWGHPEDTWNGDRPFTLSMHALLPGGLQVGMSPTVYRENPAHHRYPIQWTGDHVEIQASVESMVDQGVHGLKPYVTSDCGGMDWPEGGELLRWTSHCALGNIFRYHGADHRPWVYGENLRVTWVMPAIRKWIQVRYKLMPSLIAFGQRATQTGFPLVARGDLYWPELGAASASNTQYIFLDDILVAPIFESKTNLTSRAVWLPPGDWQDVWDGSVLTGPKQVTAAQPWERTPMWFRYDGGLIVTVDSTAHRIAKQDWSSLVLEVFPSATLSTTKRSVYERGSAARTDLTLTSNGANSVSLAIGAGTARGWVVRFHLRQGQGVASAIVDGSKVAASMIAPAGGASFVFGGQGSAPPPKAGPVAELILPSGGAARTVQLVLGAAGAQSAADAAAPAADAYAQAGAAAQTQDPYAQAGAAAGDSYLAAAEAQKAQAAPAVYT